MQLQNEFNQFKSAPLFPDQFNWMQNMRKRMDGEPQGEITSVQTHDRYKPR